MRTKNEFIHFLKRQNWTPNAKSLFKKFLLDEQIMRLLYFLNKPEEAIEILQDKVKKNYS